MAKIGAGTWSAWWRQGLKELRAIVSFEGSAAQPTEYGMYGTKTPGEVAQSRQAVMPSPGTTVVLGSRMAAAQAAARQVEAVPEAAREATPEAER